MRLGGIFDHEESAPARDLQNRVHVSWLTIEVHGNDSPGLLCDLVLDL